MTNYLENKKYTDYHRKHFALNRNSAGFSKSNKENIFTIVSNQAKGPYITDIDNNTYIDLTILTLT